MDASELMLALRASAAPPRSGDAVTVRLAGLTIICGIANTALLDDLAEEDFGPGQDRG
jgi:hypothetical protein